MEGWEQCFLVKEESDSADGVWRGEKWKSDLVFCPVVPRKMKFSDGHRLVGRRTVSAYCSQGSVEPDPEGFWLFLTLPEKAADLWVKQNCQH